MPKQRTNSKVFFQNNYGYDLNLQRRFNHNHAPNIEMMKYQKLKSLKGLNSRSKLAKRMKGRPERLKATASWQGRSDTVHPAPASWQDMPASIPPATTSWQYNSDSIHPAPSSWPGAGEVSRPMAWGNEYWEEQSLYDPYQYRSG